MIKGFWCLVAGHQRIETVHYTILFEFAFTRDDLGTTEKFRLEICGRCFTLFKDDSPQRPPFGLVDPVIKFTDCGVKGGGHKSSDGVG